MISDERLQELIRIYTSYQGLYLNDSGAYKLFTETISALQELKVKRERDVLEIHK